MVAVQPDLHDFVESLLSVDRRAAQRVFERARADAACADVMECLVVPAMEAVGDAWAQGAASLSQVYMGARICQSLVESMPHPSKTLREAQPRLAVAVFGDGHSLGKRLVLLSLRSAGYEALDLGAQQTSEELVAACAEHNIQILFISVLMLRAALAVAELKAALAQAGRDTKLVVGGAPFRFDADLWREVGADRFGYSASDATRILAELGSAS